MSAYIIRRMSFFAILFALLLEQARPLSRNHPVHAGLRAWAVSVRRQCDTDADAGANPPWLAWLGAVVLPALLSSAVYWMLLHWVGYLVALAWSVAVLYVTLGFGQAGRSFAAVRRALEDGDEEAAREALSHWLGRPLSDDPPRSELLRATLVQLVRQSHLQVFGVFVWFTVMALLGLGPAGAVLYRAAQSVREQWGGSNPDMSHPCPASPALQACTRRAWELVDWVPARLTALGFAMAGSFEEAIDGWRTQAGRSPCDTDALVLAAASGALHVHLHDCEATGDTNSLDHDEAGAITHTPRAFHLRNTLGLVWRLTVVWLLLLLLLNVATLG